MEISSNNKIKRIVIFTILFFIMGNKIQSQNITFEKIVKKTAFILNNDKVIKYHLLDSIYGDLIIKKTFFVDEYCLVYTSNYFNNKFFIQFKNTKFTFIVENEYCINNLKNIGYEKIMQNIQSIAEYVSFDSNGGILAYYEINKNIFENFITHKIKYPETDFVVEEEEDSFFFYETKKIKKSLSITFKNLINVNGLNLKKDTIFDELETMVLEYADILKLDKKNFDYSIDSIKYLDLLFLSDKYSERDYHKHILFIILYCAKSYIYLYGGNIMIDNDGFVVIKEKINLTHFLLVNLHPYENNARFFEYSNEATNEEQKIYKQTRVSAIFEIFCP